MRQDKVEKLPKDEPGGRLAGRAPGVYASDQEYLDDMLTGMPKLKAKMAEALSKKKAEQEAEKQAS